MQAMASEHAIVASSRVIGEMLLVGRCTAVAGGGSEVGWGGA